MFEQPILEILDNGARKIALLHQQYGFDTACQSCTHLSLCHTGCPVVKFQNRNARSYTCELQQHIYADNPRSYPADTPTEQARYAQEYRLAMHPSLAFAAPAVPAA